MSASNKLPFQQLLSALLDQGKPLQSRYYYRFSDLEEDEIDLLKEAWPQVPVERRRVLMEDLEQLGEQDSLLSFEALGRFALNDSDPKVRSVATRMLWDFAEKDLVPIFLDMMVSDEAAEARAAAASALGIYVYLGEIEELPEKLLRRVEDNLLKVTRGVDDSLVRRRALESLGFSSRLEVPPLIQNAYVSGKVDWLGTALFAMGRSASKRWTKPVLEMLNSDTTSVCFEAARAAGELELSEATEPLIELLQNEDMDIRLAAAWSLSQIGGGGVREALEEVLEGAESEDEVDLLEDALDNLTFTEEVQLYDLIDFPDEELEDEEGLYEDLDQITETEDDEEPSD
jgi:hypothetical protein